MGGHHQGGSAETPPARPARPQRGKNPQNTTGEGGLGLPWWAGGADPTPSSGKRPRSCGWGGLGGDPSGVPGAPPPSQPLCRPGPGEGGDPRPPWAGGVRGGTARIQLDHVGVHPPLARAGGRHGGRGRPRGSGRAVSAAAEGRGRPAPRRAGKRRAARRWEPPLSLSPLLSLLSPLSPTGPPPRRSRSFSRSGRLCPSLSLDP